MTFFFFKDIQWAWSSLALWSPFIPSHSHLGVPTLQHSSTGLGVARQKLLEVLSCDSDTSHYPGDLGQREWRQNFPKEITKDRGRRGKVSLCPVAKPGSGAGSYQYLSP